MRLSLARLLLLAALLVPIGSATAQSPPPEPLLIHGFNDISLKNAYITPRGLLVTNNGLTTQILNGLVLNAYSNPAAPISDLSFVAGIWNDLASSQRGTNVGIWNEFDWFVGGSITVNKVWNLGVTYIEFLSPPGNFNVERNIEFHAKFDDSPWMSPLSLKPYVKLFLQVDGPSVVVTGRGAGTFDVELGIVPTLDLKPYAIPATLTVPTWITVGPSDFWGGGGNAGVFSTGITTSWPLDFVPRGYGSWKFNAGFQYYHLINNNLLAAQRIIGSSGSGQRDIFVGFGGISMNF